MSKNCGECLMEHAEIVPLNSDGICPKCGADYSIVPHVAPELESEPDMERDRRG